ncbi:BNR/Asp-box repeat protein [Bifidobacterium lemurum]|uniref:BNR/Asp-box repeat protein n=1 Tax=Bifidobacterium lemurum TaxID=1603886 RepID=A0A261FS02_9BIFI|nr:RICIN domain-containing protein [Bifidobacterium lemurum]OZG61970.1 BNR/Asp-box repeat protein [Bifidobacterium lemurum]QOL35252.1 RICIN domain-containing protein [Bifidobacterium lemurum]
MSQPTLKTIKRIAAAFAVTATMAAVGTVGVSTANAYTPAPQVMYEMDGETERCNKGGDYSGCIVYPKAAQLDSGRIVATFERSVGDPVGETLPVYASDDGGDSWQKISEVPSPHDLEPDNPEYSKYVSNWTNPYLYVLPETVGDLQAGTLLLASVVSGDDVYYKEQKAAQGDSWYNGSDGDRKDMAIALFSSDDGGVSWDVLGIVTEGGWQGGSARAGGKIISSENTYRQVDPVWEPYLMVYDGMLVCYYSDERDYSGYDSQTGVLQLAADDETGADNGGQVLAHRTWDGTASSSWSEAVLDVAGKSFSDGKIGNGRPGMANVVQTTDGKWMMTYEDWGGNGSTKYKIADSPLEFYKVEGQGTNTNNLPVSSGSKSLAQGGSPVLVRRSDGSLLYNASGSGDVWINQSGSSDGEWTEYKTTLGGGYSRNLTCLQSGRVLILHTGFSGSLIQYADIDFGDSEGDYYVVSNKSTGKVLGTGGKTQDASFTGDVADIVVEDEAEGAETQLWHLQSKSDDSFTFLNKSGGRAMAPWGSGSLSGKKMAQWVDEGTAKYEWTKIDAGDGYYRFRNVADETLYLTAEEDGSVRMQPFDESDDSQLWSLTKSQEPVEVDKSALSAAVEAAEAKRQADYTEESWAVFAQALEAARATLADADADQATVDGAVESLTAAMDGLQVRQPDGEGDDDADGDGDADGGQVPSGQPGSDDDATSGDNQGIARTGAGVTAAIAAAVALLLMGAAVVSMRVFGRSR